MCIQVTRTPYFQVLGEGVLAVIHLQFWTYGSGLAVPNINESQLQTNESKTVFIMTSLPYYCIPGLAGTR